MEGMKRLAWLLGGCMAAWAQGPTSTPSTLNVFTYTMNSGTYPASQTVKVALPTALASLPILVTTVTSSTCGPGMSSPCGWLAVTPDQGHSPLTLTVSANPTGLPPGTYPGSFTVDSSPGSGSPLTIYATFQIANPPSKIQVNSPSSNFQAAASANGTSVGSLTFNYTTGAAQNTLVFSELDVSSTGDIIPFNVTI